MKRVVIIALMSILLIGQAYFLGLSDIVSSILLIITIILLFIILNRLRVQSKRTLRSIAIKDSLLYNFLSRENNIFIKFWVLLIAIIFSITLVVLLKGVVIKHGYIVPFLIVILVSAILYTFINKDYKSEEIENNVHEDVAKHGNEMTRIFFSAIVINIAIALTLSAKDTFTFHTADINLSNWDRYAYERSVEATADNKYTRIPINIYVASDALKLAFARVLVENYPTLQTFYFTYGLIAFFNLFKFTIFSLSLVLLQRSLDRRADQLIPYLFKAYSQMVRIITPLINKIQEKRHKREEQADKKIEEFNNTIESTKDKNKKEAKDYEKSS